MAYDDDVRVSDYGRGIQQDELDQIGAFMQFKRALHEQQGLGLGLVIVRRIVELHQGSFEVVSKYGEGTRVHFSLVQNYTA